MSRSDQRDVHCAPQGERARDVDTVVAAVTDGLASSAREVVPWFLEQMPAAYFRDTDEAQRLSHLRAIVTARASSRRLNMLVKSRDETVWTFFSERDRPGLLADLLREIPKDAALQSAKAYSAEDGTMVLDTFRFGEPQRFDPKDADLAAKRVEVIEHAVSVGDGGEATAAALGDHFEACAFDYLHAVRVSRIWEHFGLCHTIAGTDDTVVRLADDSASGFVRIDVAVGGARPPIVFERLCAHLGARGYSIRRAYLDVFDDPRGLVAVVGLVMDHDARLQGERPGWARLSRELGRLRWVEGDALRLAYAHAEVLDLVDAEIAVALAHLAHARLSPSDPHAYSLARIVAGLQRHPKLARDVARLFSARFDPDAPLDDEAFATRAAELRESVEGRSNDAMLERALGWLIDAVVATRKTNLHVSTRQGLAFRLNSAVMCDQTRTVPFGVFYVHGRGFDAFHVRFRDVARGGIRVVCPRGSEQHAVESRRLFDEVYDLASAQQLKNKDIPEGGSKGVILLEPEQPIDPCVRAFTDGILDLLSPACADRVVDRLGMPERLYLGPDENISPAMIEWIVAHAARRGYPQANVLMSSKPGAGINHKEYGVTSEGVTVFLEEALRHVGIDPRRQPFSVKLTGGPDGDVAGNEIKILFRDFGEQVRIVGIADGSGSAEDPDGLDRDALLALVERAAPIAELPPESLGERGRVTTLDNPDGAYRRNTLHNRVLADAFVPAGGRPATIHDANWADFLVEGRPSSRVIVEGANLFVTPGAREALAGAGVVVVKDSSANKCGVITSSFEIAAGMLLSEEELLAHKPRFVGEVLQRLRAVARAEARLLFREHSQDRRVSLPQLSVSLSRAVERMNDAVIEAYPGLAKSHAAMIERLIVDHLPKSLVELAGERIADLPEAYRAGIVASQLATRLVYREGLAFVAGTSDDALVDLALRYLRAEDEARVLVAQVRASELVDKDRIASLIELGGPRAGLLAES
jgi:glutamate dehydrogenase